MAKKRVAVLFGGSSAEHDVSIMSAASIIKHIDKSHYITQLIGFDRKNQPYLIQELHKTASESVFENGEKITFDQLTALLTSDIDVVFPIIHGPGGEDGQLQGFLKFLGVPFVGADVTASAVCMDKRLAKEILRSNGFKQAPFMSMTKWEYQTNPRKSLETIKATLDFPIFVKPSNLGSSLGIHKVASLEALDKALEDAFRYDYHAVIESGINARELECGVLGNENPIAMAVGEIVASHEFYDYEAKYSDDCPSELIVPARVSEELIELIRSESVRAYRLLGVEGMARVDFLVDKETLEVYLSELNTLPGFTKFSMYPSLCEQMGLSYSALITELIELAFRRVERERYHATS